MIESEKIAVLKTMVDSSDTDEVLSAYLTIAGVKILARAYPYDEGIEEVPKRYQTLQCEIAAYLLNKRGAEGQTVHDENGIKRTYESADVPESMLSQITPYCGVVK